VALAIKIHLADTNAKLQLNNSNSRSAIAMYKRFLSTLILGSSLQSATTWADPALATSKNCMTCHAIDKKIVGPAYKDVATKYVGDKSAVDKLATKIQKGGAGVWGPVPMPANTLVSDTEAKKLAAWVLTIK
jgi:cytochrome c